MKWYFKALGHYADFGGRVRRKEYWMFVLFNVILGLVAMILDNIFGWVFPGTGFGIVYLSYSVAVLLPSTAVTARRLHDTGRSGWFMLIYLLPIVGSIWLLVLLCSDGDGGTNRYGKNPKTNAASWNAERSSAVTFIVGASLSILAKLAFFVMKNLPIIRTSDFSFFEFVNIFTAILPMAALIACGIVLLINGRNKRVTHCFFTGYAALYALRIILGNVLYYIYIRHMPADIAHLALSNFMSSLAFAIISLLVYVSLLLTGMLWMRRKNISITVWLMIVGACLVIARMVLINNIMSPPRLSGERWYYVVIGHFPLVSWISYVVYGALLLRKDTPAASFQEDTGGGKIKAKKNVVKKTLGVFLILIVMTAGICLSVLLTKLYIDSGMRAVIFYKWFPIPFIAIPALMPSGLALGAAFSIKGKFWND
jgi:uncharacterized membrane protein YhaH (DUF805 family)